jgi:hypothetical protein
MFLFRQVRIMDKNLTILRLLQIMETTDRDYPIDLDGIRSRLMLRGIRAGTADIRRDIRIIRESGREIVENKGMFWMDAKCGKS